MGNFENTLFHSPVKISASPNSKSDRNSDITSLAFWFRNMLSDAPSTLLPLNKLCRWMRIPPTKNVTFISSMWITSWKVQWNKELIKWIGTPGRIWGLNYVWSIHGRRVACSRMGVTGIQTEQAGHSRSPSPSIRSCGQAFSINLGVFLLTLIYLWLLFNTDFGVHRAFNVFHWHCYVAITYQWQ